MITCGHCGRDVPVAPHFAQVSVPHARLVTVGRSLTGEPCTGNEKRTWRDALGHPATTLALQHAILDDDRYWEGL